MGALFFFIQTFLLTHPATASSILKLPHLEKTLPNGLRLVFVRYPSPGLVAYQIPVHVGSRNEVEKGKTGFAHFFEHLMFRGTKKRTAKQFGDLYVRLGCENNAWTGNDMTNYHGVVSTDYLSQILEAEADRFQNLSFDEKALKDEAGAVLGEYNKDVANPDFILEEKLAELAFQKHPYGHTTMGYKEDVLKFTERFKDVWPFFKNHYRPSNVSIVLVGDFDFSKMESLIQKNWGQWKNPTHNPPEVPKEPEQNESRKASLSLDKPMQTRIAIGYKIPAFSSKTKDTATANLIAEIYFSTTSDFQKKYRFEKRLIESISVQGIESVDPSMFTLGMTLSGEGKAEEIVDATQETLSKISTDPNLEQKLALARERFLRDAQVNWFSSAEALASRIAWYTNFERDLAVIDKNLSQYKQVSAADIREFSKKYFVEKHKNTVVLKGN